MSAKNICQDVRLLLQARSTQLMLTDAIVGLVAKGVYLAAKYDVLSSADQEQFLDQLKDVVGADDITEAVQALRFKYEFVNKFGEVRRGQMSQLIRVTIDRAAADRVSRSEQLTLKDYSFTFRELSPLVEMLREARNYFAHNTSDREDIGWNGLIISAIIRILERGNFLDKQRVEERVNLKARTTQLFTQLVNTQAEPILTTTPAETNDCSDQEVRADISSDVIEKIDSLSFYQDELLSNARSVESQLSSLSKQIDALKVSTEQSLRMQSSVTMIENVEQHSSSESNLEIEIPDEAMLGSISSTHDESTEKNYLEDEPVLASETLISVDMLYEELEKMKGEIKSQYETDSRWRGPSSNFLQRPVITAIVTNEPNCIDEILKYDDVKWRIKKESKLLNEQARNFGDSINELLARTAWSKDYR